MALKRSIFTFLVFLIPAVRLIWNRALNQILFQSGIQIVLAESRFVRKTESTHNLHSRKRFVTENGEKSLGRCFILVGYLVVALVDATTKNYYFRQTITDDSEHEFYESCAVRLLVGYTESIIISFLPGLDQVPQSAARRTNLSTCQEGGCSTSVLCDRYHLRKDE